jgi:hypothetical protein
MGLSKVMGFAAEAEIMGVTRGVNYDGNNGFLVIHGVGSAEEAQALLDNLSLGALKTARLEVDKPAALKGNGAHAMQTTSLPPPTGRDLPEREGKPAPVETAPAAAPAKKATKDPKPAETLPGQLSLAPEVVPEVPAELAAAKRWPDVVSYFFDKGVKDVDAIVAELEKVKGDVAMLKRVGDLRERVTRTIDTYFKDQPA